MGGPVNTGYQRQLVHCDMHSEDSSGAKVGYTLKTCDGCSAVIPYAADEGDCAAYGLTMMQWDDVNANAHTQAQSDFSDVYFPSGADSVSAEYLCGTNDEALDAAKTWNDASTIHISGANDHGITHEEVHRAEDGKFVIYYHVSDSSGNPECEGSTPSRTVIVRDTLPPVITLHMGSEQIHMSDHSQTGLGGKVNLAI